MKYFYTLGVKAKRRHYCLENELIMQFLQLLATASALKCLGNSTLREKILAGINSGEFFSVHFAVISFRKLSLIKVFSGIIFANGA